MTINNSEDFSLQQKEKKDWVISLTNLKIDTFIGVLEKEKKSKQTLCINIKCHIIMPCPKEAATYEDYLCYDELIEKIKSHFEKTHTHLLETAVENICHICFQDQRVHEVWVRCEKLNLYSNIENVGVEAHRKRKEMCHRSN